MRFLGPGSGYYGSFGGGNLSGNSSLGFYRFPCEFGPGDWLSNQSTSLESSSYLSPLTSGAVYPQPIDILGSYEQNVTQHNSRIARELTTAAEQEKNSRIAREEDSQLLSYSIATRSLVQTPEQIEVKEHNSTSTLQLETAKESSSGSPPQQLLLLFLIGKFCIFTMESPLSKPLVTFNGIAKDCAIGPTFGRVDIGVNEIAYLFRVALPGLRGSSSRLKCNITMTGRVDIEGVITESKSIEASSKPFEMILQQLCPPGPFTVSFNLPGSVDPRIYSLSLNAGILEVVVLKFRIP